MFNMKIYIYIYIYIHIYVASYIASCLEDTEHAMPLQHVILEPVSTC